MDISGVLPLPSPSSSRHCQKWATAVTPTILQHSDINVLCIQLPNNRHRKIEHLIPSKTQPRTARNCITRAPTRRLKFLPHKHALHTPPRAVTCRQYLPRAPTRQTTLTHVPHTPAAESLPATSALSDVTHATSAHVSSWPLTLTVDFDRWPLTLTIVKIFQQDLFYSVFRVDSDFELHFCI